MKKILKKRIRRPAIESKERILKAALSLVAQHGWEGLSIQMIAKKCKTSPSNVLYHFADRVSLLRELLELISIRNFQIVAESIQPKHHAFERLWLHFEKNLEWAQKFPEEAQIVIQIYLEATHDREFSALFQSMICRAQNRILESLLAGVRENIFHFKLEAQELSQVLHHLLVGTFITMMGSRLATSTLETRELKTVLRQLTGFQTDGDEPGRSGPSSSRSEKR